MAIKTFHFYDAAVGSYGKLDEGSAPASNTTTTKASGNINANFFGEAEGPVVYGSTVTLTDSVVNSPGNPNGSNGLRTLNPLSGVFAAGTWSLTIEQVSNNIISSNYQFIWNLYKSADAGGSGATLIQGDTSSGAGACNGTLRSPTVNISLGALTFNNEYLFWTIAIDIVTARTSATTITGTLRTGNTAIVTPDFAPIIVATTRTAGLSGLEAVVTPRLAGITFMGPSPAQALLSNTSIAALLGFPSSKDLPGQALFLSTSLPIVLGSLIIDVPQIFDIGSSTDASTAGLNLIANIGDSSTAVDTPNNTQVMINPVSDVESGIDTIVAVKVIPISIADTIAESETMVARIVSNLTIPDTGAATEVVLPVITIPISILDSSVTTDATISTITATYAIVDTIVVTDVDITSLNIVISIADSMIANDIVVFIAGQVLLPALSVAPTIGVRTSIDTLGQVIISATAPADVLGSLIIDVPQIFDIGSSTDATIASKTSNLSINDLGAVVDTPNITQVMINPVLDTIVGNDSIVASLVIPIIVTDSAAESDNIISLITTNYSISDTTSETDSTVATMVIINSINDTSVIVDTLTVVVTMSHLISDIVTTTDTDITIINTSVSILDTTSATDVVALIAGQVLLSATSVATTLGTRASIEAQAQTLMSAASVRTALGSLIIDVTTLDTSSGTDTMLSGITIPVAISDTGAETDIVIGKIIIPHSVVDAAAANDIVVAPITLANIVTDTIAAADAVVNSTVAAQTLLSAISVAAVLGLRDSSNNTAQTLLSAASITTLLGSLTSKDWTSQALLPSTLAPVLGHIIIDFIISDNINTVESLTALRAINMIVSDNSASGDAIGSNPQIMANNIPDIISALDAPSIASTLVINIVDSVAVSDIVIVSSAKRLAGIMRLVIPAIYAPTTGQAGTIISINSSKLSDTSMNDVFSGQILSSLWVPTVALGGTVLINNSVQLSTMPTTGSTATITNVNAFLAANVSIQFILDAHVNAVVPTASVDYGILKLAIDTNNFIQVARRYNTLRDIHTFEWSGKIGGVTIQGAEAPALSSTGTLRIVATAGVARAYAIDGLSGPWHLIGSTGQWPAGPMTLSITSASSIGGEPTKTYFDNFQSNLGVIFGLEPSVDITETASLTLATAPSQPRGDIIQTPITIFNHSGIIAVDPGVFIYTPQSPIPLLSDGSGSLTLIHSGSITGT